MKEKPAAPLDSIPSLRAGWSRQEITPEKPIFLAGYPHVERISAGVHDPLWASALALESGGTSVMLVVVDLLVISAAWTRDCRTQITAQTGIPPGNIMITASHTHSSPVTATFLAWKNDPAVPPVDTDFAESACAATAQAAIAAWQALSPAEAAWTSATVPGVAGGNRLDPDGPEDPSAGLLFVRHRDGGEPLAIATFYGMHPTVLHEDSKLVSSDFIHFSRRALELAFPGAGVLWMGGVFGDQSPRRVVRAQTFDEAGRVGAAIGQHLIAALRETRDFHSDFVLSATGTTVELQGKQFPAVAEARERLEAARAHHRALQASGADRAVVRTAECTVFGAEEFMTMARAEASGEAEEWRHRYRRAEIQMLRLGPVAVAGWPGEFFVAYGLEVKARSPLPIHVCTCANGELQGYIVTPEAERAGGYEAQMGLFPAAAGRRFVEATLELAKELA
jgi:neutral ceramidase